MMRRTSVLLVAAVAVLTARPRRSFADDPPCAAEAAAVKKLKQRDPSLRKPTDPEAVKHLDAAARAFGVGEYDTAIDEYTAAGLIDDAPLVLYNLGQTYRAEKDYEKAIRQYTLFIDRGQPGVELRALVECQVRTMKDELDRAASTAPPRGPAPDETSDEVPTPPPTKADASPHHTFSTKRKIALGAWLVGVVGVGGGVALELASRSTYDDAKASTDNAQRHALTDRANQQRTFAEISASAGVLAVGLGVWLWISGHPTTEQGVTIAPQVGSDGSAGVLAWGRF